ncbi:MAG: hypothetical protein H7644_13825 [Candidatus Heimdallarchaeota archaeon]|nr:hypothetical protein [Candidatus Heimdallarchaeota archaeon]MCK5144840.1 hypothetical protein [Candidatus Heimdallarchaeota archaeon]
MNEFLKKAESWFEKLKTTTQMVKDVSPDTILTNGWDMRKLYIHLYGWDNEFLKYAEELKQGKLFHVILEVSIDEYNQRFFDENERLDFAAAEKQFLHKRKQMISECKEILAKYPQNNKEFTGFFFLWEHDAHHLQQAGADISNLREK